ncbi:TPA: hypothetical protein ENS27_07075 [bacterium]|nr:hypothetical protein [bacterium]
MQEYRVAFKLVSSYETPFQADTIFGHICWAIRYLEGESALLEFLSTYEANPPMFVSDGFPLIDETYYIPMPTWPFSVGDIQRLLLRLNIDADNLSLKRDFVSAFRAVTKKSFVDKAVITERSSQFDPVSIIEDCFNLRICPKSMSLRDVNTCKCQSWVECPAFETGQQTDIACEAKYPSFTTVPVAHNVINRWSCASDNLFVQEEIFPANRFFILIKTDNDVMPKDRLQKIFDFITLYGYGRDKSTGKGAFDELTIESNQTTSVPNADGFINLSSSYVPMAGEMGKGYYNTHIKRGKLGGHYVLQYSPWKRPVLMIKAGSIFEGIQTITMAD